MTWVWPFLALLVLLAGLRYLLRLRSVRSVGGPSTVDDDDVRRIVETGSYEDEDDEPLDLDEAARAEEEFWDQSWDEPEEYDG